MNDSKTQIERPSIVRMLIPLLLTAGPIVYSWILFLSTQYAAQWQNYTALIGFLTVLALFIKNRAVGTVALGIYLILAITTVCSLTYNVFRVGFKILSFPIHLGNPLSWGIFIIYFSLNMNSLFDYYLDYKERKGTL